MLRSGSDGLHVPEKEATVSNILQIIRYNVEFLSDISTHFTNGDFDFSLSAPQIL